MIKVKEIPLELETAEVGDLIYNHSTKTTFVIVQELIRFEREHCNKPSTILLVNLKTNLTTARGVYDSTSAQRTFENYKEHNRGARISLIKQKDFTLEFTV